MRDSLLGTFVVPRKPLGQVLLGHIGGDVLGYSITGEVPVVELMQVCLGRLTQFQSLGHEGVPALRQMLITVEKHTNGLH